MMVAKLTMEALPLFSIKTVPLVLAVRCIKIPISFAPWIRTCIIGNSILMVNLSFADSR
jgi:hypothetical protein